jgi:hypothetical protein
MGVSGQLLSISAMLRKERGVMKPVIRSLIAGLATFAAFYYIYWVPRLSILGCVQRAGGETTSTIKSFCVFSGSVCPHRLADQ